MVVFLAVLLAAQALQSPPPSRPTGWVAFSADLKITNPKRPDYYGRYVQDEHGCSRRDTVYPNGAPMVAISNFQQQKFYRLTMSGWTVQPMRMGPDDRRPIPPIHGQRVKKAEPVEGYETWVARSNVKSPRGDYVREFVVIPALNDFEAVQTLQNGDTITAFNIRIGTPDHAEFAPPPNAAVAEVNEPGGFMSFQDMDVVVQFGDAAPLKITATEETPSDLRTPGDDTLALVTTVTDPAKDIVRIRVMKNAKRVRPGVVQGDVMDEIVVSLGQTAKTTKLVENFSITVTRVGLRRAQ